MKILFLLIPIAIIFVTIAVALFYWAVKSGQFDDLESEGRKILFDDKKKRVSDNDTQDQRRQ